MDKHTYALDIIGELLEGFETMANATKRAIENKTKDHTLTEEESYILLSVFTAFIKAQDELISKRIAKELMFIANADHCKDPIS